MQLKRIEGSIVMDIPGKIVGNYDTEKIPGIFNMQYIQYRSASVHRQLK